MNHDGLMPDAQLADEMERVLIDDLTSSWFPRAVDPRGGYFENFDHHWQHMEDDRRTLVHQSRLAWSAARFAEHDNRYREEFSEYALHGIKFIRDVMYDSKHGGFYFDVAMDGAPLRRGSKHAYATAFALFAAARVWAVTGNPAALEVAREAMSWLDRLRRNDSTFHEAVRRDGTPMLHADAQKFLLLPLSFLSRPRRDPLGQHYGATTLNTHLHLLESYVEIHRAKPDEHTRSALKSLMSVISERFFGGRQLRAYLSGDRRYRNTPAGHGHAAETAYLLLEAADAVGPSGSPPINNVVEILARDVRINGTDEQDGGTFNEPADKRKKIWWVQAESLNLWVTMYSKAGTTFAVSEWRAAADTQWTFIRDQMLDRKNGGWLTEVRSGAERHTNYPKSSAWIDPYHSTRSLARGVSILRAAALQHSKEAL